MTVLAAICRSAGMLTWLAIYGVALHLFVGMAGFAGPLALCAGRRTATDTRSCRVAKARPEPLSARSQFGRGNGTTIAGGRILFLWKLETDQISTHGS
jgi:hypothetical protein